MAAAVCESFSCFFEAEVTSMFINASRLVSPRSGVVFWVWAVAVSDSSSEAQRNRLKIGILPTELVPGRQPTPGSASANSAGEPGSNWRIKSSPAEWRSSITCSPDRSLIFVAPTLQFSRMAAVRLRGWPSLFAILPNGSSEARPPPLNPGLRGHLRGHTRLGAPLLRKENQGVTRWCECANALDVRSPVSKAPLCARLKQHARIPNRLLKNSSCRHSEEPPRLRSGQAKATRNLSNS